MARKGTALVSRNAYGVARAKLENIGIDRLCERIEAGESMHEIARDLRIAVSTLHGFLNRDGHAEKTALAMQASAESWLDRGTQALNEARGGDTAAVQWARAVEQHCARRAAIRNPRYSERAAVELTGPNGGPVQTQPQVLVYLPDNGRDRTLSDKLSCSESDLMDTARSD